MHVRTYVRTYVCIYVLCIRVRCMYVYGALLSWTKCRHLDVESGSKKDTCNIPPEFPATLLETSNGSWVLPAQAPGWTPKTACCRFSSLCDWGCVQLYINECNDQGPLLQAYSTVCTSLLLFSIHITINTLNSHYYGISQPIAMHP